MRKFLAILIGRCTLLLATFSAGCSSSNSNGTTSSGSISLSSSTAPTIDQDQAVTVTATLVNDTSNQGVTWTLSGLGTLSDKGTTSVTYLAPTTVTNSRTVKITATSVTDTSKTASLSIVINPPPSVTNTSLPSGTAGAAYSESLNGTGGTAPYTWGVVSGQIPPGLSLNTGSGIIRGTPTTTGTFSSTIQLTDAARLTATVTVTIVISPPPPLTINQTSLPNGTLNLSYGSILRASGGVAPYTWTMSNGALPSWAKLNGSTGVISGTPNAGGTTSFTVKVTDSESTP